MQIFNYANLKDDKWDSAILPGFISIFTEGYGGRFKNTQNVIA